MRQTSGIIINNDIFINSSHVVKMDKSKIINGSDTDIDYTINIYMLGDTSPIVFNFENESDRNVIFNKIVMELYGHNYAYVNF